MDLDVSFPKDIFTKDEFNVDRFLQESCQKSGLHKLHKELGSYIKYLQSTIVDLVNNESSAIVNLSSDLKVLQNKFGDLSTPLGQLREELMQIYKMIDANLSNVKYLLNKKESIASQKCIKLNELRMLTTSQKIGSILETHIGQDDIQMEIIERSVNQYIMQHMYSQLCSGHNRNLKNTDILCRILNNAFLKSIKETDADKCTRCLQMYMLMNAQGLAEELYRNEVVRPALLNIINEEAFFSYGGDLSLIYNHINAFVDSDTGFLLGVTSLPEISGFDFIIRSVWAEASEQLELNLGSIFAPGNPGAFQKRFLQTWSFLRTVEQRLTSPEDLRAHDSYRRHLQHWNLKVYFEIRQIDIVDVVETALGEGATETAPDGSGFRVAGCARVWFALQRCFAEDVFLPQLLDRFWRLALQIISRLDAWVDAVLVSSASTDERLGFITRLHADLSDMSNRLPEVARAVPPLLIPKPPSTLEDKLISSLRRFTDGVFPSRVASVERAIVEHLYTQCGANLNHVSQIPRLYRKTNRSFPVAASPYVEAMCRPPHQYLLGCGASLAPETAREIVRAVHVRLSGEYRKLVEGVLTSVTRTEESLRRLKKTRAPEVVASDDRASDDHKIRAQLQLDVAGYARNAQAYVDVQDLLALAKDAAPR